MHLQFRAATTPLIDGYPSPVVTQGLQAVWDLRDGGPTTVGVRSAPTKVLGVDTLPAGATYSGGFLRVTGTVTMDNWDFTTIASGGYVYTDGSGTVTFNDCIFGFHPSTTASYSLIAADTGTVTTTCNYCTFDGDRTGNNSTSAAVNMALGSSATTNLNYCKFIDQPEDGIKFGGGNMVVRYCRFQHCGWDVDSDPDMIQCLGGTIDCQYSIFDCRDASSLGVSFTGQPQNNFFRAESFSANITAVTFKHNICVGMKEFTGLGGYTSIDAYDRGSAVIYDVTNILYENNVIAKGKSVYMYNDGSARYPLLTGAQWFDNIDFDTGATIAPNT